ncbi:hypothetical protein AB1Y20_003307 [Prymnesium parvum]|uniref:Uncharacterized protein n=1 Tax=Prymnesium parvum TaxID=97485 RepID=A0AB34JEF6_PRYPA
MLALCALLTSEAIGVTSLRHPGTAAHVDQLRAAAESSNIEKKYRELQEYRAKLAQEGKVVMPTYDPKKSEDVKNERLAGADLATKQGERILAGINGR